MGVYDCSSVNTHGAGVYVFFDDSMAYYIGEADDVARRLLNEHCSISIGGSEGIVKFLMYYLNDICESRNEWIKLSVKGREDFIKELLRDKIRRLKILIVTCNDLNDEKQDIRRIRNRLRIRLENCVIEKLNPILNLRRQV